MTNIVYIVQYKKTTDIEWIYRPNIDVFKRLANAQDRKARFDKVRTLPGIVCESRIVKVTAEIIS